MTRILFYVQHLKGVGHVFRGEFILRLAGDLQHHGARLLRGLQQHIDDAVAVRLTFRAGALPHLHGHG